MKAVVDQETCIGCGLCPSVCPEVFKMNDDGKAEEIVNEWTEEEITRILFEYGEEKFSRKIARHSKHSRAESHPAYRAAGKSCFSGARAAGGRGSGFDSTRSCRH